MILLHPTVKNLLAKEAWTGIFIPETKLQPEMTTMIFIDVHGKKVTKRIFHTWRALFCHYYSTIFTWLKVNWWKIVFLISSSLEASSIKFKIPVMIGTLAFDAANSSIPGGASQKVLQWTHTCTGSNRIMAIMGSSGNQNMSAASYNSVAATNQISHSGSGGSAFVDGYTLVAPTSGSALTVEIDTASNTDLRGTSISFSGGDQTTPADATVGLRSSSNPIAVTMTTTVNNDYFVSQIQGNTTGTITPTSGIAVMNGSLLGAGSWSAYWSVGATIGSVTKNWANGSGISIDGVGMAIKSLNASFDALLLAGD